MTDLHTYTSTSGTKLSIRLREQDVLAHGSTRLFLGVDDSGMFIPTADLLAVIDAADPDAMRAYLRETVEHEVPEADSPEDVDEHPDRYDPTERAQIARSWALGCAHELFPHASLEDAARVAT